MHAITTSPAETNCAKGLARWASVSPNCERCSILEMGQYQNFHEFQPIFTDPNTSTHLYSMLCQLMCSDLPEYMPASL